MKSTLDAWCAFRGQQGSTIHDALAEFSRLTQAERDRFCGILADGIRSISDPATALEFMRKRNNVLGIVTGKAVHP